MLNPEVSPQVLFGSPTTGANSDSLRRALGKYNTHTHSESSYPSFFTRSLVIGSSVTTITDDEQFLFTPNTTLVSYSDTQLTLSTNAIRDSVVGKLLVGTTELTDLVCTIGSSVVTKDTRPGFVHPSVIQSANTKIVTGKASASVPTLHPILLSPPTNFIISRFSYVVLTGSATLTLETESRVISTLDSTPGEKVINYVVSSSSNPKLNQNASLGIRFSAISNLTEVFYTAYLTPVNYGS
jgi:hypothetical protein